MLRSNWHERWATVWAASGIVASLALVGAWADLLPGGWSLRGCVEAHESREARDRALHAAARLTTFAGESSTDVRDAVVFLGSSTIERCPAEELFPGVRVVNHGIGWARAGEIARHLDRLLPVEPRGVVLYAGSPDRLASPLDVDGVLRSIADLAREVRARAPSTPVLLLGLLPTTTTSGAEADALAQLESGIARIALEHGFAHVDFAGSTLVDAQGVLREEFSADGLHLNARGYEGFARRLRAAPGTFARLLAP